jgi:hypothetical protein
VQADVKGLILLILGTDHIMVVVDRIMVVDLITVAAPMQVIRDL